MPKSNWQLIGFTWDKIGIDAPERIADTRKSTTSDSESNSFRGEIKLYNLIITYS